MNELETLRDYETRYTQEIRAGRLALEHGLPVELELSRRALLLSDCKKAIAELTVVKSTREAQ